MEDFYFPYVLPQETGNHEDTRWAAFVTEAGNGICIASDKEFSFGALHYTQEDLTQATHTNELHKQKISSYLLIMHSMVWEVQAGVPSVWKKINCIRNRLHLPGRFSEPGRNRW